MWHNLKYILCAVLLTFAVESQSQQIVTVDFVTNISRTVGQLLLVTLGVEVDVDSGVDIYRVTYTTVGSDMALDTASGLIMTPSIIDRDLPILVYQHGTTDGRSDVPSNLDGAYQLGAIFAGKGMIVLAPDFLGLGTSRGFHPFVHAQTEATAAVDLLRAALPFLDTNNITWNEQLFVTGYSQGGHAAMAFHKYVQEELPEEFEIYASLPMSGPYSISDVMRDIAFNDEPFGFPAYLVYTSLGIQQIYPELFDSLSQIFKPPYLPAISEFARTGDGLFDMNESLISTLVSEVGMSIPRDLFTDSILTIIQQDDQHIFNVALRESDVYDWTPEAPVLMLYCEGDDQVPFRNSVVADSVMNLRGAEQVSSMEVSGGQVRDHTQCIVPALNVGIPWLLGFIDTSVPVDDLGTTENFQVFPNPTNNILMIESERQMAKIEIFNFSGQKVLSKEVNGRLEKLQLGNLNPGMYVCHIYSEGEIFSQKIVRL